MKKIVIAEDEKTIRKGIEVMLKNTKVPYDQIYSFKNGLDAWEFISQSNDIDLLITDVKMPKMNGVQLVEHCASLKRPPHVLVLSGYSDFDYVVEMLRQGAIDYLLKPLNREDFEKRIFEIESMIEQNHHYHIKMKEILQSDLEQSLQGHTSKTGTLASFLYSYLNLDEESEYQVICTNKEVDDKDSFYLASVSGNHFYIVFDSFTGRPTFKGHRQLDDALELALFSRMSKFYSVAQFNFDNLEILEENYLVSVLQDLFLKKKYVVTSVMRDIIQKVENEKIHPESLNLSNQKIYNLLDSLYGFMNYHLITVSFPKNVYEYNCAKDYILVLDKWERMILSEFDVYESEERSKINAALDYLNQHYKEDINMAVVSNQVSLNYSVFSQLFKEHVGVNFVDYLKKLRIEKSKELLENSDLLIKEVSETVGYQDYKYFTKLFKQEVGMSPREYRRIMGH